MNIIQDFFSLSLSGAFPSFEKRHCISNFLEKSALVFKSLITELTCFLVKYFYWLFSFFLQEIQFRKNPKVAYQF